MDYSQFAIFSDLDGTLFNEQSKISPENRAALEQFMAQGGLFGLCTGRSPSNAATMLDGLQVNTWSVMLGGAEAYHFPSHNVAFPKTLTRIRMAVFLWEVLELLPQIDVLVYTESRLFFLSDPEKVDPAFWDSHQPASFVSLSEALYFPWLKVLFRAPREVLQVLEEGAARRGIFEICSRVYTREDYLEFLPVGVHKGMCLRNLRTLEELKDRKFVVVGDGLNDLEALGEADIAVAVENALPIVKYRAGYMTASNENHALARLIYDILPTL